LGVIITETQHMTKTLGLLFFLTLTFYSNAQTSLSSKDSIKIFYDSLFITFKSDYLLKNEVNWTEVETEIKGKLANFSDFKSSLSQTTILFDKIKATHCQLFYKDTVYTATPKNYFTEKDFSEQWLKKYSTSPAFEVKVIDNNYGYILMPAMNFEDVSPENINKLAQPMYDQIAEVKSKKNLKGWIIDLRFNTGGHVYPMLLALYDFLGNNIVYGVLDNNQKLTGSTNLNNGNYYDNKVKTYWIKPQGKKLTKSKVVLVTGIVTGSSGEITAISFKGRKNTLFIGEKTSGTTTTNEKREFPFGIYMAFTVGYDCDRNGNFYEAIIPDIAITKQDNFDNLRLDKNIQEAVKWINRK
jgi:carboxyl-terminal processing protease